MRPYISICIPTYNRAKTVDKCVANILSFKKLDFECVVCDNASTDETEEILKKYISDQRFRYYKNDYNQGYRNTYTTSLHANGKYCFILSDEDMVLEEEFENFETKLKQYPNVGVALCNYRYEDHQYIKTYYKAKSDMACLIPQYMSGICVKRDEIEELDIDFESYLFNLAPHQYMAYGLLEKMDGLIIRQKVINVSAFPISQTESSNKDRLKPAYREHWRYESRKREFISTMELIKRLKISKARELEFAMYHIDHFSSMMVITVDLGENNGDEWIKKYLGAIGELKQYVKENVLGGQSLCGALLLDPLAWPNACKFALHRIQNKSKHRSK